jgi:hypothetical protein
MAYQKAALVRFALRAEQMSQALKTFGGSVNVNDIANALGMTQEDGFLIATYLDDLGWARMTHANPLTITLTPLGYDEIAKLRRPQWRQWIDQHPLTMNGILMTGTAIISGMVYSLITYWIITNWMPKP